MSLLTICKSVLAETGWTVLPAIASSQDATARQIFELAKSELTSLSQEFTWPHLESDYAFSTVIGQRIYAMPVDFESLVHNSVYDKSEYDALRGSVSAPEWRERRDGFLSSIGRQAFRLIFDGELYAIELANEPSASTDLVLSYRSKYYAKDAAGAVVETYETDTDVSRIPEHYVKLGIKWRFRRVKGMDFSAELNEYNGTVRTQVTKIKTPADIPVGGRKASRDGRITDGYVADSGFGS